MTRPTRAVNFIQETLTIEIPHASQSGGKALPSFLLRFTPGKDRSTAKAIRNSCLTLLLKPK